MHACAPAAATRFVNQESVDLQIVLVGILGALEAGDLAFQPVDFGAALGLQVTRASKRLFCRARALL